MRVLPDYTYNFVFITAPDFSALDGIYKVLLVTSYDELLEMGVDLKVALYTVQSLEGDFDTDLPTLRDENIYKVKSVVDGNIVYIPEHLLKEIPDASVQKYLTLGIAINLGIHDDAQALTTLKSEMDQIVQVMTGVNDDSIIYEVKDNWMTEADYLVIKSAREALITRTTNHYTEKLELQQENANLQNHIAVLETAIKDSQP